MTPWQVLRACRGSRAALGYHVHHGQGAPVHYSTAQAAAPDGSRSFCLSRGKVVLQDLNKRLASYLQQVKRLEAANQKLERQIQEALAKKCPGELKVLDRHLRTVSLLQNQIGECHSTQAQVKLQLLNAELTTLDLSAKYEKEHESRSCVEAELGDLRQLWEELKVQKLPELQSLLTNLSQQQMELQTQHQQDMQDLLPKVCGDVAMKLQTPGSSDLIQQLEDLRRISMTLLNENQNENYLSTKESGFKSSEMLFGSTAESEVNQAELKEMKRTAASLEVELTQLQALNRSLEASGLEQTESFDMLLEVLQERADSLNRDLDSVLKTAAGQAADYQTLLDTKSRLETEINEYKRLLDGFSKQNVHRSSGLRSYSAEKSSSNCAMTTSSTLKRNTEVDKTVRIQGNSHRMNQVQAVSRDHIHSVEKPLVLRPPSETVTKGQVVKDKRNQSKSHMTRSVNISNKTGSFKKSETENSEAPTQSTERETMTITSKVNSQSIPVDNKVNFEDHAPLNAEIVRTESSQSFKERAVVKESKMEEHISNTVLASGAQSTTSVYDEAKPENPMSKQTTMEVLKQETLEEIVSGIEGTHNSDPSKMDHEIIYSADQEAVLISTKSTKSSSQTDSGVALSLSSTEEHLSPLGGHVFVSLPEADSTLCTSMVDKQTTVEVLKQENLEEIVSGIESTHNSDPSKMDHEIIYSADQEAVLKSTKSTKSSSQTDSGVAMSLSSTEEHLSPLGGHVFVCLPEADSTLSPSTVVKRTTMEVLKQETLEELVSGIESTHNSDPPKMDNEIIYSADQEAVLISTKSTKSSSQTDSGVAMSLSSTEEHLSPLGDHVFVSLPEADSTLSVETRLSPVDTEMFMDMTDQVFCPVDPDSRSPDSILSPMDPEMFFTPSSDFCFSPDVNNECPSPNFEDEDEETCFSPTEANVRPVEKYVLTTKEEGQSLSFSEGQDIPEENNRSIVTRDKDSMCFGSLEDDKENIINVKVENVSYKSTSRGTRGQLGGLDLSGPSLESVIADKEKQLGFGGLYRRSEKNVISHRDVCKTARDTEEIKIVQSLSGSSGSTHGSDGQKESNSSLNGVAKNSHSLPVMATNSSGTSTTGREGDPSGGTVPSTSQPETGRFNRRGSGEWKVSGSLGRSSSLDSGTSLEKEGKGLSMATSSEGGRYGSQGSGEWVAYGGRLGHRSSSFKTRDEEAMLYSTSPPGAVSGYVRSGSQAGSDDLRIMKRRESLPSTLRLSMSPPETGRFDRRGSGEWRVYGSLGRRNSQDGQDRREEEGLSLHRNYATGPQETGRFGRRGSGEWMMYGGSLERREERRESLPAALLLSTSPPDTGRFGSRGSGEWRGYGEGSCRISSWAGSGNLSNAGSNASSLADIERAMSPPSISRTGRVVSGGSGEWKVYSGSTGHISKTSSADGVRHMISPPSSRSGSGQRLSSAGSGGRLSSGSVVRRSSSVGSGGRLGVSSSGRYSSAGSGEQKPVYSSTSGRRSNAGSVGLPGGTGKTGSQRAPSPGGKLSGSVGRVGWHSSSMAGGNPTNSAGSGSQLSSAGGGERKSSQPAGKTSSSSGSGRTTSAGGRVISSSSNRSNKSTGSGTGGSKQRISVCKMAALSISAARRDKSQEKRKAQQQQQAGGTSPLLQRWLIKDVGVPKADLEGLDDIPL